MEVGGVFCFKGMHITRESYDFADRMNEHHRDYVFGGVGHYPTYHETMRIADLAGFVRAAGLSIDKSVYQEQAAIWYSRIMENFPAMMAINPELTRQIRIMHKTFERVWREEPPTMSIDVTTLIACEPEKYAKR